MSGVLLSPGPIATKVTVQGVSRVFNNAVNKAKFLAAAGKLQEAGFGELKDVSNLSGQKVMVFIKKPPEEVVDIVQMKGNSDLCTWEEYEMRFRLPPPATISKRLRQGLVNFGHVPAHYFPASDMQGAVSPQPQSSFSSVKEEHFMP